MARTALIVGAGIGGLSAGIALRRAGWDVRIFERAATPRELGFGLALAPNALQALAALGVADVVLARSFAPDRMLGEFRRMDGTSIKRVDLPFVQTFGTRMAIALRPALHGALLDAIGADTVAVNSDVTRFSQSGNRVTIHLANGETAEGDLLVGADGMWSVTRRALHPSEPPPPSSRIVAVRGAVHGAQHHLGALSGVYYLDAGVESIFVRASETGIYWFLSLARELVPDGMRDPAAVLAHMSPRFDSTFQAITSATDDLRFDELFDRDPIPYWSQGVVTLLGDAAHPLLPHTGQGAAQAIIDGVTLGNVLSYNAPVERALQLYERERRGTTAALLRQGRLTARVMRMRNPIACALRERLLKMTPLNAVAQVIGLINHRAGGGVTG